MRKILKARHVKESSRRLNVGYFLLLVAVFIASSAFAEDKKTEVLKKILEEAVSPIETILGPVTELERIVVTPSRTEEKLGSASCSVSVITDEDFDRKKVEMVKDSIKEEVGVDIRQAGAFQGTADVMIRGGRSNQTLIMIDGIKAYDPIDPGGAYNIANLTLDNIKQIEILRGPQSALYGSDAMAGVVNIMTKKATDTYANATWEGGSFYTYKEIFEAGYAGHGFHASFAGSRLDTKGISQAEAKHDCQERDPLDRTALAGRADYDIGDTASVGATFRYTKSHFAIDQGADADDDNAFSIVRETFGTLYGDLKPFEWWRNSLRLGWMDTIRQYFDDDSPLALDFDRSKYSGKYFKLNYQSEFDLANVDKIVAGYEFTKETARFYSQNDFSDPLWRPIMLTQEMPEISAKDNSMYLENRFNLADRLTSTQGMRVSRYSTAGTHVTYRLDASYLFATGTKIRGLAATGLKAPSLYQLYAPSNDYFGGGNPSLQPEKSSSYEYGIDQYLFGDKVIAGVTYFHTLYTNLIDALTNPNTWVTDKYINIGKAQVHGIEATLKMKPVDCFTINLGLTYQKTKDFQNDQEMIRRPERKFFVECFLQATKALSFDLRIKYNGPMSDNISGPTWNTYKVKQFVVMDGIANYDINKMFSVYVKADNIFNKYYEEVRGFTSPPFSLYGGIKAKF